MRRRDHRRARRRCRRCRGRRDRRRSRHRRSRRHRDRYDRDTAGGRGRVRARGSDDRIETIVGESGRARRAGKARLSRVVRL